MDWALSVFVWLLDLDWLLRDLILDRAPDPLKPYVPDLPPWAALGFAVLALAGLALWNRKSIRKAWLWLVDRKRHDDEEPVTRAEFQKLMALLDQREQASNAPPLTAEDKVRRDQAVEDIVAQHDPAAEALKAGRIDEAIKLLEADARAKAGAAAANWRRIGDLVRGFDFAKAWQAYEEAFKLQPDDFRTGIELARLRQQGGKLAEALVIAQAAEKAARSEREKMIAAGELGDISVLFDDLVVAGKHFEEALKLAEMLVVANPTSMEAKRDLSVSRHRVGLMAMSAGDLSAARTHFEADLKLVEELAAAKPNSVWIKRDLSVSRNWLGDVAVEAGDLAVARTHYDISLKLRQDLVAANPISAEAKRDLSISYEKLGHVAMKVGDLVAARTHYEADVKLCEELAAASPSSAEAQRDLSYSYTQLGAVAERQGDVVGAIGWYEKSLPIARKLAAEHPDYPLFKKDLEITEARLAALRAKVGR